MGSHELFVVAQCCTLFRATDTSVLYLDPSLVALDPSLVALDPRFPAIF